MRLGRLVVPGPKSELYPSQCKIRSISGQTWPALLDGAMPGYAYGVRFARLAAAALDAMRFERCPC